MIGTMQQAFVIGISGGSGSGKSTFVNALNQHGLSEQFTLLRHDSYYLNRQEMPNSVRDSMNWDHPDSLDNQLFVRHLTDLKSGHTIEQPIYDFTTHSRVAETHQAIPRPVILVEGILLLAIPEIRELINLRIYVDTPADLRIVRRAKRDTTDRGRTLESVFEQYESTVRPMHLEFVEPSKIHADLIVPWEQHNHPAIDLIVDCINRRCRKAV
jgi:uridine kinase